MIAIDTNVLIYSIDAHEPLKCSKARALIRQMRGARQSVIIPWQVSAEFLRYLHSLQDRQVIDRAALERIFWAYFRLFPVILPTLEVMDRAMDLTARFSLSHWDSLLIGACIEAGVTQLHTEDMGAPRTIGTIQLLNPFA